MKNVVQISIMLVLFNKLKSGRILNMESAKKHRPNFGNAIPERRVSSVKFRETPCIYMNI